MSTRRVSLFSAATLLVVLMAFALLLGPQLFAAPQTRPSTAPATRPATAPATRPDIGVDFVNCGFENASPVQWTLDPDGTVNVFMSYDYERNSPNRAAGHWHFEIQGKPGTELAVVLHNFDNVWNGRYGAAVSKKTIGVVSSDGKQWRSVQGELLEGSRLRLRVKLEGPSLFIARCEPYRLSDLAKLIDDIRPSKLVEITDIGKTVEGRPLEIVRVGNPDAPRRIFLRARAHAWEPGGNWVVEGLVRSLLSDDALARECLARYCLYILPIANKDGVARGLTRFNMLGKDLNRDWDKPADPRLAPENHAIEQWLATMIQANRKPHLAMDFHNDENGQLHVSRPPIKDVEQHLARMARFEQLLRKHTWFTEGSTKPSFRNSGTIGEGLLERYGIDACILEFNANFIAGLNQPASAKGWQEFGHGLRKVFLEFFTAPDSVK